MSEKATHLKCRALLKLERLNAAFEISEQSFLEINARANEDRERSPLTNLLKSVKRSSSRQTS